jgi:hypothetical protein
MVGKPDGKRPVRSPRRRWTYIIKIGLFECWGLDWSGSGQVQVENSCERGNEPSGNYRVAAQLVASRVVLSSKGLV